MLGPFILGLIVFIIVLGLYLKALDFRCPACKKYRALVQINKELTKSEPVSKIEELKRKDNRGNVIGTREHRIYGTRKYYRVTLRCKYCHEISVRADYEDTY